MSPRFFVLRLGERDHRPRPEASYEIQMLDSEGRAKYSVYIDSGGQILTHEANVSPSAPTLTVPRAVIEAVLRQPQGQGDYVDETGKSIPPF